MTENGPRWPDATNWPATLGGVAGNELLVRGGDGTVIAINYTFAAELYTRLTQQLRELLNGRTQMTNEIGNLRARQTANNSEISTLKGQVDTLIRRLEEQPTTTPDTAPIPNLGMQPSGTPAAPFIDHELKKRLKTFAPKPYNGQASLEAISKFFKSVEHYVRLGGGSGMTQGDKCIDVAWKHMGAEIYDWFVEDYCVARSITLPTTAYQTTWQDLKTTMHARFIPQYAISAVRNQYRDLRYNKSDVLAFNERVYEFVKMLGGSLKTDCTDPLFEEYVRKLPQQVQDQITSAQIQSRLCADKPFTLGDAMTMLAHGLLKKGFSYSAAGETQQQQ